ncbi:Putative protein C16orf86 like protein [Chelonia mydas]|uniref:Uncharacterized protein n=1 Tax=Chelonia mydas TaxID=8469 RepID=M7B439_CHEMY|nr:Putative protein C16orf86 like protein [Chelonia mydas]
MSRFQSHAGPAFDSLGQKAEALLCGAEARGPAPHHLGLKLKPEQLSFTGPRTIARLTTHIPGPGCYMQKNPCCGSGRPQRLRPLYQYINYDNPELNSPSEDESDTPGTAVLGDAVGAPDRANPEESKESHHAGTKSDNPESCSPGTPPQAAVDKSTQVDIDKMLSVCAAHLVPPLSPQYK